MGVYIATIKLLGYDQTKTFYALPNTSDNNIAYGRNNRSNGDFGFISMD